MMGTSTSGPGPGKDSPLVPPWADATPNKKLPPPPPRRFQSFRTELGKYALSGEKNHLTNAMGHYAKTATGGASVGPRRFGAMAQAGGFLAALINDLRQGGDGSSIGVTLPDLIGRPIEEAIDDIVNALTPSNSDADKIRVAFNHALSKSLEGRENFDPTIINDEMIIEIVTAYVSEFVFQQIMLDSDRAFQKCKSSADEIRAENGLLELITAVVDKHLPVILGDGELSIERVKTAQLDALKEVWNEWETEL